mmetsp:Transcript_63055/g.124679  ORF Transcript_63055/g.124679 Transcript_63055/m.124679 type:complete len:120 (+) Transcript_63055:128-487(+)
MCQPYVLFSKAMPVAEPRTASGRFRHHSGTKSLQNVWARLWVRVNCCVLLSRACKGRTVLKSTPHAGRHNQQHSSSSNIQPKRKIDTGLYSGILRLKQCQYDFSRILLNLAPRVFRRPQ